MIKQTSFNEWNPQYDYVDLCEVQLTVGQFKDSYGITFEKQLEDGLGECFFACVEIDSTLYSLFGPCNAESSPGIAFRIQGNNPSVENSIHEVKKALLLEDEHYSWIQDHFTKPRWALFRQGDDGNEVEIDRFYKESVALHNMRIFEDRGHKQVYTVREII